jgi:hypothetical protein
LQASIKCCFIIGKIVDDNGDRINKAAAEMETGDVEIEVVVVDGIPRERTGKFK